MAATSLGSRTTHRMDGSRAVSEHSAQEIAADGAEVHLLFAVEDGRSQLPHLLLRQGNDVIGQPLGGLLPHPGQLAQLIDQALNGLNAAHFQNSPGMLMPPVILPISRCHHQVLEHFHVLRVHRLGVDDQFQQFLLAVYLGLHHAAPRRGLKFPGFQLLLELLHVLL